MGLSLLLGACEVRNSPVDFKAGEHQCEFCMMGIVDLRFRGEVISPKGKVHFFDSIECVTAWSLDHPEHVHSVWVGDFLEGDKWVSRADATIVYSSKIKSPMGAGLLAHGMALRGDQALKMFEGRVLNEKQLEAHVMKWRKQIAQSKSP